LVSFLNTGSEYIEAAGSPPRWSYQPRLADAAIGRCVSRQASIVADRVGIGLKTR
jgi:hypothetical protein